MCVRGKDVRQLVRHFLMQQNACEGRRGPIADSAGCDTLDAMRIFSILLCCHLAAASVVAREQAPGKAPRPDVFLITIDTLRADHVHCYGYDRIRTPALDQLAKQGVRFAEAFTPSPITNSSHVSILTGLLPSSQVAGSWS